MKPPEKELLHQWIAGNLEGESLIQVEKWADENPALASSMVGELEEPMEILATVPASLEPPYADFLNSKIEQQIKQSTATAPVAAKSSLIEKVRWVLAPVAIGGMALCFFMGTQFAATSHEEIVHDATSIKVEHTVYVPNESVVVEVMDSEEASMIILDGLEPISDDDLTMVNYTAPDKADSVKLISAELRDKQWY